MTTAEDNGADSGNATGADVNKDSASSSPTDKSYSFDDIKDAKGVSLTNRIGEFSRKMNKISDLESKIDQLLTSVARAKGSDNDQYSAHDATSSSSDDVEVKIERRLKAMEAKRLESEHLVQFESLKKKYPELDKNSDGYDPDFYKSADSYYKQFNLQLDPKGAIKAVEFAAFEAGKTKQQAEKEVLQDEKRRSRKLAEGAGEPKKAAGDNMTVSSKTLAKLGIKSKYLEKAMKNLQGGE